MSLHKGYVSHRGSCIFVVESINSLLLLQVVCSKPEAHMRQGYSIASVVLISSDVAY